MGRPSQTTPKSRTPSPNRRGGPPGAPAPGRTRDARDEAAARPTPPAEDFADRRDIETADEPVEEHDARHHDGGRRA
jgi:hypothetical protein